MWSDFYHFSRLPSWVFSLIINVRELTGNEWAFSLSLAVFGCVLRIWRVVNHLCPEIKILVATWLFDTKLDKLIHLLEEIGHLWRGFVLGDRFCHNGRFLMCLPLLLAFVFKGFLHFQKEFLCMRTNLRAGSCANESFNFFPVLSEHLESWVKNELYLARIFRVILWSISRWC